MRPAIDANDPTRLAAHLVEPARRRGRGSGSNRGGRFEPQAREDVDDGWESGAEAAAFATEVSVEKARRIITRNDSPDIGFDRSINPYRGCEHGCSYCYARPTHAHVGLSPGLDFETKLFAKDNAAELLRRELSARGYQPRTIALGANTDPYQPLERTRRLTRAVLEVLAEARHPVGIVTKSDLVVRDIDLLAPMAREGLAKVAISITTLDGRLARAMEPRAPTPAKRLAAIRALSDAGIPTAVLFAPVIPAVNDHELERVLAEAHTAGAREAGTVLLRLPLELRELFRQWLLIHRPDRLRHVLSLVQSTRAGKDYDAAFGLRQRGTGPYADLIARRFELARERMGFARRHLRLRTDLFRPPSTDGQLSFL